MRQTKNLVYDFFFNSQAGLARSGSYFWVALLFFLEVIALSVVHLPVNLTFYKFAFHDEGSNLTVQFLIAHGFRPVLDFGFSYGLLTLTIEHIWFAIAGMTPYAYQGAMLTTGLLMAWGLARFASNLQLNRAEVVFMVSALPIAVMSSYANFSEALEAALLCNALAEQAGGNRRLALTLAGIACLVKPALGYFYVLLLIALAILRRPKSDRPMSYLWQLVLPAGIVGGSLVALVALMYGWKPLLWTLFPVSGAETYRYLNNGFFRAGSTLYYFRGVHLGYYFGTIAGFYLFATASVFVAGIVAAQRLIRGRDNDSPIADELMVVCAILHAIFIFGLFGNAGSWSYYSYILVMGVVLAMRYFGAVAPLVAAVAIGFALLSNTSDFESAYKGWRLTVRSDTTAGLWAFPAEIKEWSRVNQTIDSGNSVALSWAGCAFLLDARLQARPALYTLPFQSNDREIQRYASQIRAAQYVVAPSNLDFVDWSQHFPEIHQAVDDHRLLWQGKYFEVFRRQ
jgi:hypothetical protein